MKTFLRRLEILHYLQQRHAARLGPVGTEQIIQHLLDGEYVDDLVRDPKSVMRLIQRDLKFLLGEYDEDDDTYLNSFGLMMTRGLRKSQLWSLDPYQQVSYDFEKMPAYMALALTITQKHLKQVLPNTIQKELSQVFLNAENRLQQAERKVSAKQYSRLGDSVEFYQRGQSLSAPEFDMATLDGIYQAILKGKRIRFSYVGAQGKKVYDVHPHGVAIMLPKLYLIAVKEDDIRAEKRNEFRSFLVHRIEELEVLPFSNSVPDGYTVREYLDSGNMDVQLDQDDALYELVVELRTRSGSNLLRDLQDSPLNESQTLKEIAEGQWQLTAQVRRTVQLRNWLLALGADANVTAPSEIQNDLRDHLRAMLTHYT